MNLGCWKEDRTSPHFTQLLVPRISSISEMRRRSPPFIITTSPSCARWQPCDPIVSAQIWCKNTRHIHSQKQSIVLQDACDLLCYVHSARIPKRPLDQSLSHPPEDRSPRRNGIRLAGRSRPASPCRFLHRQSSTAGILYIRKGGSHDDPACFSP